MRRGRSTDAVSTHSVPPARQGSRLASILSCLGLNGGGTAGVSGSGFLGGWWTRQGRVDTVNGSGGDPFPSQRRELSLSPSSDFDDGA